jgi:hypothetical protein
LLLKKQSQNKAKPKQLKINLLFQLRRKAKRNQSEIKKIKKSGKKHSQK